MNGIHDMGGMHGFGPIEREENEPVFHAPWEGRLLAMIQTVPVAIPGGMRSAIESMDPALYLASSYYERWLHAREQGMIAAGVLTAEELDARTEFFREHSEAEPPRREDPDLTTRALERWKTPRSPHREVGVVPRFGIGDEVVTRNMNPPGHTRLPRYARGKMGEIDRVHGVHDFQDAVVSETEAGPQAVYSVRFDARELWGESAEANGRVYIDMWESYLEAA